MQGGEYAPLEDGNSVLAAHTVRNLRRETLVVHQQQLQLTDIVYYELLEPVGKMMASLLVRAVPDLLNASTSRPGFRIITTYLGHWQLALEPPAHPVINTLRFPPCLLNRDVAVRLMAPECHVRIGAMVEPDLSATYLKTLVRFFTILTILFFECKTALAFIQVKTHNSQQTGRVLCPSIPKPTHPTQNPHSTHNSTLLSIQAALPPYLVRPGGILTHYIFGSRVVGNAV